MKRVIFYFDGFNFYNGIKSKCKSSPDWKAFYWIDFFAFCSSFLPADQELVKVKYFTAPPMNPGKRTRQSALFGANKIINGNKFEIINGKYYNKNINCKLCSGVFQLPEEKRTDVNISIHLLMDCFEDNVDKLVLVTADSDLITTVQTIKAKFPKKDIKVYFPPQRTSSELFHSCKPVVYLENNKTRFDAAIMSTTVTDGVKTFTMPVEWTP